MPATWSHARRYSLSALICVSAFACTTSPLARPRYDLLLATSASLQVTNAGSDDLQLFLVRSGTAVSVGTLPGHSTRVFWLTPAQLGEGSDLSLLAKPRSEVYEQRSAVFTVTIGQRIAWVVSPRQPSEVVIVR
jgi:hypothetical protein